MFDFRVLGSRPYRSRSISVRPMLSPKFYHTSKRTFDVVLASVLLAPMAVAAITLLILNPFLNKGSLFYVQKRMGAACQPFHAYKFRSMISVDLISRGAFDPLDADRITPLGRIIRKTRIDELPQILNVLRGDMSLIGPRPDAYDHALVYIETVPGYRARCQVLPGISGYAQVKVGYVDGRDGVLKKVRADLAYIRSASLSLDMWIAWKTFVTVLRSRGS